ncbi:MAG: hypothetical protein H6619_05675 [Deltaproteobacteria bacterium]|nr:hypothetical protein [Deltaproteobacteria bacterium]
MKKIFFSLVGIVVASIVLSSPEAKADRIDDMISPITNPVNFEDPRPNTEARAIFLHHEISDDFITTGGDVRIYALQLRYAVNEDLAIIATKDGYVDLNPDAVLSDESGFGNITAGVKYVVHRDSEEGEIATVGFRYEIPVGDDDVFQGEGDGFVNPFLSGAVAIGDFNLMAGAGARLPLDSADSALLDVDLHLSRNFNGFYPVLELGLVHVIDAGTRLGIADEGADYFQFGASASDGKTLVTGAVGARYRFSDALDAGIAYQHPLTDGAGSNLFDWRVTTDLIWSFDL